MYSRVFVIRISADKNYASIPLRKFHQEVIAIFPEPIYTCIRKSQELPGGLLGYRFYGPVNLMGSCRVQSVYLTTLLLGRLSPLSG